MNKIQAKRLLNVAKALREAHAAKKKFTMEKWVFGDSCSIESVYDEKEGRYVYRNTEANFCGTPACALGHYAARTDLQRLLKIVVKKGSDGLSTAQLGFFGQKADVERNCPTYDDNKFFEHFGLDHDGMEELFGGDGCGEAKTALQAAKYIERFVKQKQFPGR